MLNNSIENLLTQLAKNQLVIDDSALPTALCENLLIDLETLYQEKAFRSALIGRGNATQVQKQIRGDLTYWLDDQAANLAQHAFFQWMQLLTQVLNESLYIGINHFEAHYAIYQQGAGYDRHIDQHAGTTQRKITFILYLNKDWRPDFGGELLIYDPENPNMLLQKIEPLFGRLVLFRSEVFQHEVTASTQTRKSLTGWFRSEH